MYERNAIVIDRYFARIFGYDKVNNLKSNSSNYFELVGSLENYQKASETENTIMADFERVASKIKETQKLQEVLNKRNLKYCEARRILFESLDENASDLKKKFAKVEDEISKNNQEIKENAEKFIEEIIEFNEKSETRSNCGRERRLVENEYQKMLRLTTDNFNNIVKDKLKEIKTYVKSESKDDTKQEINEQIMKNGAKERVPFDEKVITTAIDTSTYIEVKKAEVLLSIYDKTSKLLDEIKNDTVKIDKHKKLVRDSKSKLEYLNAISEYIILFLDNERMNAAGGEKEHEKVMTEACSNLQRDLTEIQNMYSLLIKEMNNKSTKKAYKELYNIEYLLELQQSEKEFTESISRLNMAGTVVYPDYWRLEGMQKIYDTFKHLITDVYEKDLSEYEPLDITFSVKEEALNEVDNESEEDLEDIYSDIESSPDEKKESDSEPETEVTDQIDNTEVSEELEDDVTIAEENNEEEEEFHWDDDDEDDELNFGGHSDVDIEESIDEELENLEENEDIVEENEEIKTKDEKDKEIDEILGFFDNEDLEENEENEISSINIDDEQDDDIEDKIFDDEDEVEDDEVEEEVVEKKKKKETKKKRRGLFARRSK